MADSAKGGKQRIFFPIIILLLSSFLLFYAIRKRDTFQLFKFSNKNIIVLHNAGFFSCAEVRLRAIVLFVAKYKCLPNIVDSSMSWDWYRPPGQTHDVTPSFWKTEMPPVYTSTQAIDGLIKQRPLFKNGQIQYSDYSKLNHAALRPILRQYFTPSDEIMEIAAELRVKYRLDPAHTCVLFFRGNDKATEIGQPSYGTLFQKAQEVTSANPNVFVWAQSDEQEFLDTAKRTFPGVLVMQPEDIRSIKKSNTTVDKIDTASNFAFAKKFLAITFLMSQCKNVICNTGNCSLWIALLRGHTNGFQHFRKRTVVSVGKWLGSPLLVA